MKFSLLGKIADSESIICSWVFPETINVFWWIPTIFGLFLNEKLNSIVPMLDQLDDKMLDALLQVVQYLKDHEQQYPQLVAQLEQDGGALSGLFPPEYDPELLCICADGCVAHNAWSVLIFIFIWKMFVWFVWILWIL